MLERTNCFQIDSGNEEFTFAQRLERENGWTPHCAERVIDEYKRFAFLAVVAGHSVTQSDQVDQVWHLHLTYTKSYWDRLCGQVLGKPLHHGPTRGGSDESTKFGHWYRKSFASYECLLEHEPPADIWPAPPVRFGVDLHFQRVNTDRNWIVRKPQFLKVSKNLVWAMLLMVAVVSWLTWGHADVAATNASLHPLTTGRTSADNATHAEMVYALTGVEFGAGLFVLAFAVTLVLSLNYGKRCPKYNERHAMEKTVVVERGGWLKSDQREWKCKHCGHNGRKKRDSVGGCGG